MRTLVAAGIVLILGASSAIGQVGPGDDAGSAVPRHTPSTLAMLNKVIPQVAFEETALDLVISWLAEYTEMQIRVRWQTVEDAGVERDKPISLSVKNLSVAKVLYMVLTEAGGPDVNLAYRASGNVLIISTADDLGKEMVVMVYDVSDLLVRAPRFRNAPQLDLAQAGGQGGQGGGGQNIFGGQGSGNTQDDDDQQSGRGQGQDDDIQELIELIVQTVEPDLWAENGGLGTIHAFRNLLVVRNNILVHQALGGYVSEAD
jgi:hypothetical protein